MAFFFFFGRSTCLKVGNEWKNKHNLFIYYLYITLLNLCIRQMDLYLGSKWLCLLLCFPQPPRNRCFMSETSRHVGGESPKSRIKFPQSPGNGSNPGSVRSGRQKGTSLVFKSFGQSVPASVSSCFLHLFPDSLPDPTSSGLFFTHLSYEHWSTSRLSWKHLRTEKHLHTGLYGAPEGTRGEMYHGP